MSYDGLIVASYFIGIVGMQLKSRKQLLLSSASSAATFSLYMFLFGAKTAVLVSFITVINSVAQSFISEAGAKKTLKLRIMVSALAILVGAPLVYQTPSDILPLLAFVGMRISEMQGSPVVYRLCVMVVNALWVSYALIEDLPLIAIGESLWALSSMYAIYLVYNPHRRPKLSRTRRKK